MEQPRGRIAGGLIGRLIVAGAVLLGLAGVTECPAQTTNQPQILFLHVKISNQQVSLLDTVRRPGVLKPARSGTADELHYELFSAAGESLWKAALADPTTQIIEYEDPPGSGNLKRKTVVLYEAEFTVRVPAVANAQRVEFYKLELSAPDAKGEQTAIRKSLGSVSLQ